MRNTNRVPPVSNFAYSYSLSPGTFRFLGQRYARRSLISSFRKDLDRFPIASRDSTEYTTLSYVIETTLEGAEPTLCEYRGTGLASFHSHGRR